MWTLQLPFHIRSNDLPENWSYVERVQILDTNNVELSTLFHRNIRRNIPFMKNITGGFLVRRGRLLTPIFFFFKRFLICTVDTMLIYLLIDYCNAFSGITHMDIQINFIENCSLVI